MKNGYLKKSVDKILSDAGFSCGIKTRQKLEKALEKELLIIVARETAIERKEMKEVLKVKIEEKESELKSEYKNIYAEVLKKVENYDNFINEKLEEIKAYRFG